MTLVLSIIDLLQHCASTTEFLPWNVPLLWNDFYILLCLFPLQFEIKLLNHFVLLPFISNAYCYHITFNYHIILNNFFHFLLSCLKIFLCLFFHFKFYFPLIVLFTTFSLMLFFLFNSFTLLCCDFLFYCFSLSLFSFL